MADDAHVDLAALAETHPTARSPKDACEQPPASTGATVSKPDVQQAPEAVTHAVPPRCRARTRLYRDTP